MRIRKSVAAILALFAAATPFANAEAQQRTSTDERFGVDVIHSGDDRVGTMFASAVRDALANSPRYKLDPTSAFDIRLVTLDTEGSAKTGYATAVALTLTLTISADDWPFLLDQQLLIVGRNRVDNMARELLATLDATFEKGK